MKKYLPIILVVLGILVLGGVLLLKSGGGDNLDDESNLREIPLSERPFTSLTPKEDGHWLKLIIEGVKVKDAKSIDYELLYEVPGGVPQGVPGTVPLTGEARVERDLLLGSESKGKFRYDEGVETGTLTLRFRNDKGKLIGKLSTEFHLQKDTKELSSVDKNFNYLLNKDHKGIYFVTMNTFGLPIPIESIANGPYGVFASKAGTYDGEVGMAEGNFADIKMWDGSSFVSVVDNKSNNIGVFVGI